MSADLKDAAVQIAAIPTLPIDMTISSNRTPTVATALAFLRDELTSLQAYTPHPGGAVAQSVQIEIDRVETNESPYDLPPALKQELARIWADEI